MPLIWLMIMLWYWWQIGSFTALLGSLKPCSIIGYVVTSGNMWELIVLHCYISLWHKILVRKVILIVQSGKYQQAIALLCMHGFHLCRGTWATWMDSTSLPIHPWWWIKNSTAQVLILFSYCMFYKRKFHCNVTLNYYNGCCFLRETVAFLPMVTH